MDDSITLATQCLWFVLAMPLMEIPREVTAGAVQMLRTVCIDLVQQEKLPKENAFAFACEFSAILFLMMASILSTSPSCNNPNCNSTRHMYIHLKKDRKAWRCPSCTTYQTIYYQIVFKNANLKPHIILKAFYYLLAGCSASTIITLLQISKSTMTCILVRFKMLIDADLESSMYDSEGKVDYIYFVLLLTFL